MRLRLLSSVALAVLSGCTCLDTVNQTRFACETSADCLPSSVCRGGECRVDDVPSGTCFAGQTKPCTPASCQSTCGADAGWQACTPASGGGFDVNPQHCGECGRACSTRLGDALGCIDSHCACVRDDDCPAGDVCGPGGVCVMASDVCAHSACDAGTVCRAGACAPVACDLGCALGELCDVPRQKCRPVSACKLATACGDGGTCEGLSKPDGEQCDDGVACTTGDTCAAGACTGTTYACPAPSQCEVSVACAGDGGCVAAPRTDGASCDDGVACTHSDQCSAGVCQGTTYACTPGQCSSASVCNGEGGCAVTPRSAGATCDDGQACTAGDTCGATGQCNGTGYACPAPTACQQSVACAGDGGCVFTDKADGSSCDDGVACTQGDSCTAGACAGVAAPSYRDVDGDQVGDLGNSMSVCPPPAGYVLVGGDCDDGNPFVRDTRAAVRDVDRDGVTASTTLNAAACVGASSLISGRTYFRDSSGGYTWLATASASADCNDFDSDVFNSRPTMVVDFDHDGFGSAAPATACVGASSVINGRTYYANTSGVFVYLDASAALTGTDCNDASASTFPTTYYRDFDGDGFGLASNSQLQCPQQTGWVSNSSDCNDSAASEFQLVSTALDVDQDGYATTAVSMNCVGVPAMVNGRTYYSAVEGVNAFVLGTQALGATDCNPTNGLVVAAVNNVLQDDDQDGYPFPNDTSQNISCAGPAVVSSGRTYYSDGAAGWWLAKVDCIGRSGNSCPNIDCYDLNANARPGQTTYFTTERGDGSFDYNCSGAIGSGNGGTSCASVTSGVTTYSDTGTCGVPLGTATVCELPTALALPAACGKFLSLGTSLNVVVGTCTTAIGASSTQVSCR